MSLIGLREELKRQGREALILKDLSLASSKTAGFNLMAAPC